MNTVLTTSDDRVVHTLYGPKTITNLQTPPHGNPLPGAPIIRRVNPIDDSTLNAAAFSRTDTTRRATRANSSLPYGRPRLPTAQPQHHPPVPSPTSPSFIATFDSSMRDCIQRLQEGLDGLNMIGTFYRRALYRAHVEAKRSNSQREAAEQERDLMKEQLRTLTLGPNTKNSSPPSPLKVENETARQFSMVGPLRTRSSSPTALHSGASSYVSKRKPKRSKSAEPCFMPRGADDCFDLTIIGYNTIPPQSPCDIKSELIRDAIQPDGPRPCPRPALPGELDIQHIDLMYIPRGGQLFCRACHVNNQKLKEPKAVKTFPNNASWDDLRDHCVSEHPTECQDIVKLHPAEIYELRRRLRANESSR